MRDYNIYCDACGKAIEQGQPVTLSLSQNEQVSHHSFRADFHDMECLKKFFGSIPQTTLDRFAEHMTGIIV